MTAAPGPQQPDEVLLDLIARRILNTVDPTDDGAIVRMRCVELVRSGGALRAAPSAQPDERRAQLRGAIEMWASDYAPQIADHILTRFPNLSLGTPAQPVRDTEERRR